MIKGGFIRPRPLWLTLILLASLVVPIYVGAAPQQSISFQARILSKDRTQAPTGSFPFRFSLYTATTGGSPVWSESWTGANELPVRYGLFNVSLGSQSSLSSLDWSNTSYWLGIEFDSDKNGSFEQAFVGRVPLSAAPYALAAKTITDTLEIAKGGTGASSASQAIKNLLPSQSGQSGKALVSNGIDASWQNISGGTDASYLTLGAHSGLDNERVLSGTVNQINITDQGAGNNVVLSLPQDIAASSNVQFNRLALGSLGFNGDTSSALFYDDPSSNRSISISSLGQLSIVGHAATNASVRLMVSGDTTERFIMKADGGLSWGDGVNDRDTYLTRSSTSHLKVIGGTSQFLSLSRTNGGISGDMSLGISAPNSPNFQYLNGGLLTGENSGTATISNPILMEFRPAAYEFNIKRMAVSANSAFTSADAYTVMSLVNGQLRLPLNDSGAGLVIGSDTNLFRSAANTLKTDDSLTIGGTHLSVLGQNDLRLYDADSSNYVAFQSDATVGTDVIWTLPSSDSSGCLSSNGTGTLGWSACAGGSGAPTSAQYLTLALDSGLSAERVLVGTTNQISLTDGGANGNLTLSTPQNIHNAATPQFSKLGLGQAANTYQLSLPASTLATGGIDFGGDTNLYRGAANELTTDDLFAFGSTKTISTTDFKTYKADGSGGIGFIFDTSSTYATSSLLSIRNNGSAKLSLSQTGDLTISGTLTQNGIPADIAENISVSDQSIAAGDIVAADDNHTETARKATSSDDRVLGVISTQPGVLISGATNGRPLALAGRVPVKVLASAHIRIGDTVVVSSTPGVGTKATDQVRPMVGVAISNQGSDNRVTVQLQPGVFVPNLGVTSTTSALSPQQSSVISAISLLTDGTLKISSLAVDRLSVSNDLLVAGTITVSGNAKLGSLELPAEVSATAMIMAGDNKIHVSTSQIKNGDRVLLTPHYDMNRSTTPGLNRGAITDGQGFDVHLDSPITTDLYFDWLIIH